MKNETNTQHTPAPWSAAIDQYENVLEITSETNGVIVAKIPFISENHPSFKKDEANAQLIARAPELLKENEQLKRDIEERDREQGRQLKLNAELLEALKLLTYGAEQAVKKGLIQPQINGGLILAKSSIAKAEAKNLPVS